jgi:DNA repair protein RecO (recombination protein O)
MSLPTFQTKAIVLKTIAYGNTSIIVTAYTALFGLQTYIVKGIRTTSKKQNTKASYFLVGNILDVVVYHQQQKNMQFIKEYQFAFVPQNLQQHVVKNAVLSIILEIVLHTIKQTETNIELFEKLEESIIFIDDATATQTANFPLAFCMQWSSLLGFGVDSLYSNTQQIFDIKEGSFVEAFPNHLNFIEGEAASLISTINSISSN